MNAPRNNTASRRDQRQPSEDGERRTEGAYAFLDSDWDEVPENSFGVAGGWGGSSKRYGGAE